MADRRIDQQMIVRRPHIWNMFGTFVIVEQRTEAITQQFGKYARTLKAGFNIKMPWPISKVIGLVSKKIRVEGLNPEIQVKGGGGYVHMPTTLHFKIIDAEKAFYSLENPIEQIKSFVGNEIRTEAAKMTLVELSESRDHIKEAIMASLKGTLAQYGFEIENLVFAQPEPSQALKDASDRVTASARLKEAAENEGEAVRIKAVKVAEGEKAAMILRGEGFAGQRGAIAAGAKDSIDKLKAAGMSVEQASAVIAITNGQQAMVEVSQNPAAVILGSTNAESNLNQLTGTVAALKALKQDGEPTRPAAAAPKAKPLDKAA